MYVACRYNPPGLIGHLYIAPTAAAAERPTPNAGTRHNKRRTEDVEAQNELLTKLVWERENGRECGEMGEV